MNEPAEIMTMGRTVAIYRDLDSDVQGEMRAKADRIRFHMRRSVEDIMVVGRELTAAKTILGHGKFLPWIEAEFGMAKRTAQNLMAVHASFGKIASIAHLKITNEALYLLTAPSTETAVVEAALDKAKGGTKVDRQGVAKIKAALKAERGKNLSSATPGPAPAPAAKRRKPEPLNTEFNDRRTLTMYRRMRRALEDITSIHEPSMMYQIVPLESWESIDRILPDAVAWLQEFDHLRREKKRFSHKAAQS